MRKNETGNGWMKILSWVFTIVALVVAGRHLLLHQNFDYVTTVEWVIIGVSVVGEVVFGLLPKLAKNKEQ